MHRSRIMLVVLACATGLVAFAGQALAGGLHRSGPAAGHATKRATAPVNLPARMPVAERSMPGAYGFRPAASLAKDLSSGGSRSSRSSAAESGSATITVTAVVLPVRTIVVKDGDVAAIWSNTPSTAAGASLYVVRDSSISGPTVALTPRVWAQARVRARTARRGPGRIA